MTNAVILYKNQKLKRLKERDENDNTGSVNVLFGIFKNRFISVNEKLFEEIEDFQQESLKNRFFKFINEGHTVFTNGFRAIPYGDWKSYELSAFALLRHLSFSDDFDDDHLFQLIYEYFSKNELTIKHFTDSGKASVRDMIPDFEMKQQYQVAKIPSEIREIVESRNTERMEAVLKLNPLTGFYEFTDQNGISFPIICRHVFMYLKNVSLIDISIECLKNGRCRYCGQEMSNYAEHLVADVPSSVVSIIYQFFELIPYQFI